MSFSPFAFYVYRENVYYVFMPISFAATPVQSELTLSRGFEI